MACLANAENSTGLTRPRRRDRTAPNPCKKRLAGEATVSVYLQSELWFGGGLPCRRVREQCPQRETDALRGFVRPL